MSNSTLLTIEQQQIDLIGNASIIVDLLLLILVSFVGVFGNVLIIVCILFHKKLKNITSLFVAHLAIADLFLSGLVAPGSIKMLWIDADVQRSMWCDIYGFFVFFSCAAVVNFSSLIALTRYIVICKPHLVGRLFYKPLAGAWLATIWSLTFLQTLLPSLTKLFVYKFNPVMGVCHLDYTRHPITIALYTNCVCFAPCVIVCVVCYFLIFKVLRETRENIARHMPTNSEFIARKLARERRATMPLFISLIAFCVHWLPIMATVALDPNFEKFHTNVHRYFGIFSIASACDNWIIYGLLNKNFAVGYRLILCYWKRLWPGNSLETRNTEGGFILKNKNSDRRESEQCTCSRRESVNRRLVGFAGIPLVSEEDMDGLDDSDDEYIHDYECNVTINPSAIQLLRKDEKSSESDSVDPSPIPTTHEELSSQNEKTEDYFSPTTRDSLLQP